MSFKKILSILLRISISIVLLFFLFKGVDRKTLFSLIKNTDKLLLFFAFIVFFMIQPLGLYRWKMLLKAVDIHLPLKRVISSFSSGIFFNLFLPSTIGGDLVRSMDLAAHTKKPKEVVATVLLDRLSGYIGLVFVSLLAAILGFKFVQDKVVLGSLFIITALLIFTLFLLFNKFMFLKINKFLSSPQREAHNIKFQSLEKIRESLGNLHREIHKFRHNKKLIYKNIVLSFIIQIISPISFYFIGLSLGVKINIIYFFVFLPIIGAITLLPISIGGLGLRDATTIYFFAKVGVAKNLSLAISLLGFFFILVSGSIGGIIYVLTIHHRRLQHNPSSSILKHP